MELWASLRRWMAWPAAVLLSTGLLFRVVLRDHFDGLAPIFYALPWPVLLGCAVWVAVTWWKLHRRVAMVCAVLAVLCGTLWVRDAFRSGPPKERGALRIAYWNLARPTWRLESLLTQAAEWNADVIAFGESRSGQTLPERWREILPQPVQLPLAREMALVGPTGTEAMSAGTLGGAGVFHMTHVPIGQRKVFVLIVDFDAGFSKPRSVAFERLRQLVNAYATQPLVVLGDFNTPHDSVHFDRLRLRRAFDLAGAGYRATWPMPVPMLAIDHILVNHHLRVLRCELRTALFSDHRAIIADLELVP